MRKPLRSLRSGMFACVIFFVLPLVSQAQDWAEVTQLVAKYPNGTSAASDNMDYGVSISISGNWAVIGAPFDYYDLNGSTPIQSAGSAFVLFNDAGVWKPVKKLIAPVRSFWGNFGLSVSISGDYIVIGETGESLDGSPKGVAYIFKKDQGGVDNWGLLKRIQAEVRSVSDNFGSAVDISGDYIVVSTRWDDLDQDNVNPVDDAGAAFIYEKNYGGMDNWGLIKKITAPVRREYHNFGTSAAIDGNQIVIGAHAERRDAAELNPIGYAGAAYIFRKDQGGANNWGFVRKITAPIRASDDNFGLSVDISGNTVIVGALWEDEDAEELNTVRDAGSAYIFSRDAGGADNWGQVKKFVSDQRGNGYSFGRVVSLTSDRVVISGGGELLNGEQVSHVYIFERNQNGTDNWGKVAKVLPAKRAFGDDFGKGLAVHGNTIMAGSAGLVTEPGNASTANAPGAVYVFEDGRMPVTLASFRVSKVENQAYLQWTTSAETNTSHFEIQKSLNAKDWAAIGTVGAAGESKASLHYTHWDNQLMADNIYYRLKMVDLDGTFAYSSIRNLLGENQAEFAAFPNPVTERIFIKTADFNEIASVEIRNLTGVLLYATTRIDGEGIAVDKFAPGTYIIQIRNSNGTTANRNLTISR